MIPLLISVLTLAAPGGDESAATQAVAAAKIGDLQLSSHIYPVGVRSEDAYLKHLERLSGLLARHLDALETDGERIDGRLAYANWILARQAEPYASRVLLGIETPDDRAQLGKLAAAAQAQLELAQELLDGYEPADADEPADVPDKWDITQEVLGSFADALAALAAPKDDSGRSKRRSASADVSANVDDPRIQVGVYARLWSALLLLEAGRADQSATTLSPALAPPLDPLPDYFARWLRVKAALESTPREDAGRYAVAVTSLYQLEGGMGDWFVKDEQVTAAERTLAFLRHRINSEWSAALKANGENDAAKVTATLEQEDAAQEGAGPLMRIERAVPVLTDERRLLDGALTSIPVADDDGKKTDDDSDDGEE